MLLDRTVERFSLLVLLSSKFKVLGIDMARTAFLKVQMGSKSLRLLANLHHRYASCGLHTASFLSRLPLLPLKRKDKCKPMH